MDPGSVDTLAADLKAVAIGESQSADGALPSSPSDLANEPNSAAVVGTVQANGGKTAAFARPMTPTRATGSGRPPQPQPHLHPAGASQLAGA